MRIAKIAIIAGIAKIENPKPNTHHGVTYASERKRARRGPGHGDTEKKMLVRLKKGEGCA